MWTWLVKKLPNLWMNVLVLNVRKSSKYRGDKNSSHIRIVEQNLHYHLFSQFLGPDFMTKHFTNQSTC